MYQHCRVYRQHLKYSEILRKMMLFSSWVALPFARLFVAGVRALFKAIA
jgi:hypothetical protein